MIKRKVRMLKKRKNRGGKKDEWREKEREREGGMERRKDGGMEGGYIQLTKHKPTTSIQHIRGNIDGNERTQFPRHSPTCLP